MPGSCGSRARRPRSTTPASSPSTRRARPTASSSSRCATSTASTSSGCSRSEGPLAPERALALVAQLAAALDAAHEHGLVHRDVKPSNALVAKGDHVYLCDFGLTRAAADDRLTATGEVAGTALYMAPETLRTGLADARSDLYSLGCVLFECLTGEPPFTGPTQAAVIFGHLEEPPPRVSERRAGLPHALDAVLARALDKDPGHRYASGAELVAAARAALAGRAPARGRRRRVVAGVVALAAAAAGAVALLAGSGDTPSAEPIEGDAVAAIDPEQGALTGKVALEGAPEGIASGAGAVWVTDRDRNLVSRVDPETRTIRQTIPVGHAPSAIAAESHGVWVANGQDGTVSLISPRTNEIAAADPGRQPGRRALRRGRRDLGRRSARVCRRPPGPRQQAPHGKGDAGQPARQAGVRRRGRVGQQPVDRDGDSDRRGQFHGDPAGADEPWRRGPGGRRRRGLGRQPARGDGVADRPRAPRRDRHGRGRARRRPASIATTPGAVWVANEFAGTLVRIDPERAVVAERRSVGGRPQAVTAVDGTLWLGVADSGASRRGGTVSLGLSQGSSGRTWTSRSPTGSGATSPTTGWSRTSARAASRRWRPTWPRPCRCRPTAAARTPSGCGAGSATRPASRSGPATSASSSSGGCAAEDSRSRSSARSAGRAPAARARATCPAGSWPTTRRAPWSST